MKGKLHQRDPKPTLGSPKSHLEASYSTNAHCLMGRGSEENLAGVGERKVPMGANPLGRVQQMEEWWGSWPAATSLGMENSLAAC